MEILLTSFTRQSTTSFTKQRFATWSAAAVAVTGGVVMGIRLSFYKYAQQQRPFGLAVRQQAADKLGGRDISRAEEEGLGGMLDLVDP